MYVGAGPAEGLSMSSVQGMVDRMHMLINACMHDAGAMMHAAKLSWFKGNLGPIPLPVQSYMKS